MYRLVEVYLNETPGSAFIAYADDAEFRCAFRQYVDLPSDDDAALTTVWAMGNIDHDSPSRLLTEDRSISVGDVVTLDERQSFSVETLGWCPLERLYTADPIRGFDEDRMKANLAADPEGAIAAMTKGLDRAMANIMLRAREN